jgi:hypothetical protein
VRRIRQDSLTGGIDYGIWLIQSPRASGVDRADARQQIAGKAEEMLAKWHK